MSNAKDFVIKDGVLKKYKGPGGDVIIPDGVTEISPKVFSECTNLTGVVIPNGVKSLGFAAFENCKMLSSIDLPDSVTDIGPWTFYGCRKMADKDGFVIVRDRLFYYAGIKKNVIIPDGVVAIENSAFFNTGLSSVTIPVSVKKIGRYAFENCGSLAVHLPSGLEEVDSAFRYSKCTVYAYAWTQVLKKLFEGAVIEAVYVDDFSSTPPKYKADAVLRLIRETRLVNDAAKEKEVIAYLTKNSSKLIPYAFDHRELFGFLCEKKLIAPENIDGYLSEAEKRKDTEKKAALLDYQNKIGNERLSKARAKKEKVKEEYLDALVQRVTARDPAKGIEGMTFVVTGALSAASRAEIKAYLEAHGAKLGSSVTKKTDYLVTDDTDTGSEKYRTATDLGVQVISESDFYRITFFRFEDAPKIEIPGWMKVIAPFAFCFCKSLTGIEIPNGITSIGDRAFMNCSNLKNVIISDSVTSIGSCAFCFCNSLSSVTVPDSVTEIGMRAFYECSSLKSIEIPKLVTNIERDTFRGCTDLTSVTIPDGVISIGDSAFDNCKSLRSVIIPKTVKNIGSDAFFGCSSLESVYTSSIIDWCGITFGWHLSLNHYDLYIDGNLLTDLTIPDSITSIRDRAFEFCNSLTRVSIPESVTSIGERAFAYCRSLTGVEIPDSVTVIGKGAFSSSEILTEVTLPTGIERIDEKIFWGCSNLKRIDIPDGVKSIGDLAFAFCNCLSEVFIPESVTDIGVEAFYGCRNLSRIVIPESVTDIGKGAFESCPNLSICSPSKSAAAKFAKKNNIPFVAE